MSKGILYLFAAVLAATSALAQSPKELKTRRGISIALVNLLHARPDCSSGAAPVSIPLIRKKPTGGTIEMTILAVNVPAAGDCAARRVPVITLIYRPKPDFVGSDTVTIDVENGNRTTSLDYRISVQSPGDTL